MADVTPRIGTRLPDPLVLAIYPGGNDTLELYEASLLPSFETSNRIATHLRRWLAKARRSGSRADLEAAS